MTAKEPYPPMDGFLSVRFRMGDSDVIEVDCGSPDAWFAVKMLRATSDALAEWAEANEHAKSRSQTTPENERMKP